MFHKRFAFVLICATILVSPALAVAQHDQPHIQHTPQPPVSGADHPEAIPDRIAFELVLMEAAIHPDTLVNIGLASSDQQVATAIVQEFQRNVRAYREAMRAGYETRQQFFANWDRQVYAARKRLTMNLTADGLVRLDSYIQSEKAHMTARTNYPKPVDN